MITETQNQNSSSVWQDQWAPIYAAYGKAFEMPRRKNDEGYIVEHDEESALPKWIGLSKSHLAVECAFSITLSGLSFVSDLAAVKAE